MDNKDIRDLLTNILNRLGKDKQKEPVPDRLLKWISDQGGTVSKTQLAANSPAFFKKLPYNEKRRIISTLVMSGQLKETTVKQYTGRPGTVYMI